jgi:hypothetical protein
MQYCKRQRVWGVLDFVQDHRWGVQLKKSSRVCRGRGPYIRGLQGGVTLGLGKKMFEQGCLPD